MEDKKILQGEVMKHIPASKREAIKSAYINENGYWIELEDGWEASKRPVGQDPNVINVTSVVSLRQQIYGIKRIEEKGADK